MDASLYVAVYFNLLWVFVLISLWNIKSKTIHMPYLDNRINSFILLLIVFVHITFRPLDKIFVDTLVYAQSFQEKKLFGMPDKSKDIGFDYLTYFFSQLGGLTTYWGVLCTLYVLPLYLIFKRIYKTQYFIALLLFVCSFSFWGYGVNGLRNGIATSLVIYGVLSPEKKTVQMLVFILAFLMHKSVLLPIAMFFCTVFFNNSRFYQILWVACLIASNIMPDFFQSLFLEFSLFGDDDRLNSYISTSSDEMSDLFSKTGFRWDFLCYSVVPIILGLIYIYKYNYRDEMYIRLFNMYLACNAFWLLVINASYSNRFAYLSWFLYPIVMSYPLLKEDLLVKQQTKIRWMIFLNYAFTYAMWLR